MRMRIRIVAASLYAVIAPLLQAATPEVTVMGTPDGGIQPFAQADAGGNVHLIYFSGEAAHGDLYYTVRRKGSAEFGKGVRVNSTAGAAIATGTVRGAQLALGRDGHVHVAWMGSGMVTPNKDHHRAPMLYARSTDGGKSFEAQRNLITESYGLDGGGAIAADASGRVEVFWHAAEKGAGESARKIWVTRSSDDGKTFAPELAAWDEPTGVCGCCGMTAGASAGKSWVLYRSATEKVHRDIYLLESDGKARFSGQKLDGWEIPGCPMSAMALDFAGDSTAAAWEAQGGDVAYAIVGTDIKGRVAHDSEKRKFPDVALSPDGHVLLAWTVPRGRKPGARHGRCSTRKAARSACHRATPRPPPSGQSPPRSTTASHF